MYDSWKSLLELYIEDKDHGRMILNSVLNGPLLWPTVEEHNGTTRNKTYEELTEKEKLQADCDLKAINIVLQGLPLDVYSLVNHYKVAKEIWDIVKLLMQGTTLKIETDVKLARDLHTSDFDQLYAYLEQHEPHATEARLMRERFPDSLALVAYYYPIPSHYSNFRSQYTTPHHISSSIPQTSYPPPIISQQPQAEFPQLDSSLVVPTFQPGDDPIDSTVQDGKVIVQQVQGRQGQNVTGTGSNGNTSGSGGNKSVQAKVFKCYNFQDPGVTDTQVTQTTITYSTAFHTDDLDAYDSDCDDISSAKAVLMANLSSYDSDVLSEVPHPDTYQNDMTNQSVQEMQYYEQSPIDDYPDNEIHSDSNIIPYSQYLQETQNAVVQDTNSSAQQKSVIISMFEQMSNHVTNWDKASKESKIINESLTVELERYKERVKILEQRFNFAAFEMEIDILEQTLSKHVKEKESLLTALNVFKTESKQRESKSINKEIDLENKNNELENIVCKLYQSTQAMHMLTKPQVFYDNTHKQALGYQNPFYLKRVRRIMPTLYDGHVISKKYDVILVVDDEETLIVEEESR
ncbi:hypothetical protein Tco_0788019 [Tanacetum coccineum]